MDIDADGCFNPEPKGRLQALNLASWAYYVVDEDDGGKSYNEPLNVLDCILVYLWKEKMEQEPDVDPVLKLCDMELNLATMKAKVFGVEGVDPE